MDWESPKLLLLILPALALLLWIESRSSHPMTGLRKRLLLVVRAIGVMLAIAALAGPAQVTQTGRKALGIVVDASQSMGEEGLAKSMAEAERVQKALGSDIDSFVVQLGSEPALLPEGGTAAMQAEWQKKNGGDSHYAAAVAYAEALFPPGVSRNILLIGDGHETRGSLIAAAREAAVSGITLHALPVSGPRKSDARIIALTPNRTRLFEGASLSLTTVFESTIAGSATLKLYENGIEVEKQPVTLKPGSTQEVVFTRTPSTRNTFQYRAVL